MSCSDVNMYACSTRPFLTSIEKKWLSFQILSALRDSHLRGNPHGDIKSSNILVTSWNWVYLTDFATSYKPTYLPLNDPADFAFFFDTSGRRTCYVAPERFYEAKEERKREGGDVKESMDVFSAGCVVAEVWLDGEAVFTLSEMFKYRSGEVGLEGLLDKIPDEEVRVSTSLLSPARSKMLMHAISEVPNPKNDFPRCSISSFLRYSPSILPGDTISRNFLLFPT